MAELGQLKGPFTIVTSAVCLPQNFRWIGVWRSPFSLGSVGGEEHGSLLPLR